MMVRAVLPLLALAALAGSANAQPAAKKAPGAAALVPVSAVIAAVEGDWNEDGLIDRAVLVAGPPDSMEADLTVALSADGEPAARLAHAPGFAYAGTLFGQSPSLELAQNGSLRVISGNDAVGRDRWRLVLTLAYREGAMRVGGALLETYDTLDPGSASSCDVNLFTGRGVRDGAPLRARVRAPALEEWRIEALPAECVP